MCYCCCFSYIIEGLEKEWNDGGKGRVGSKGSVEIVCDPQQWKIFADFTGKILSIPGLEDTYVFPWQKYLCQNQLKFLKGYLKKELI